MHEPSPDSTVPVGLRRRHSSTRVIRFRRRAQFDEDVRARPRRHGDGARSARWRHARAVAAGRLRGGARARGEQGARAAPLRPQHARRRQDLVRLARGRNLLREVVATLAEENVLIDLETLSQTIDVFPLARGLRLELTWQNALHAQAIIDTTVTMSTFDVFEDFRVAK